MGKPKLIVPPGTRLGRLTVVAEVSPSEPGLSNGQRRRRIQCKCDCGNALAVPLRSLRSGNTKSCGCLRKELAAASHLTHGKRHTRIYGVWACVKQRAVTGSAANSKNYMGRGIAMYGPWADDFMTFDTWVSENLGECPEGHSLDRVDNAGNYEPGNLRWATRIEQNSNRRDNRWIEYAGERLTIAQWERKLGLRTGLLRERLNNLKWPVERALTTPVRGAKK